MIHTTLAIVVLIFILKVPSKTIILFRVLLKKIFLMIIFIAISKKYPLLSQGKSVLEKPHLLEEIVKRQGKEFCFFQNNMINGYADTESTITWYEIPGIDLGKENVFAAMANFDLLAKNGVTNFIYCFGTNKVEELEEQFIRYVQEKYPGVKVLIVLTMCLEDEAVPILSEQCLKISEMSKSYRHLQKNSNQRRIDSSLWP